MSENNSQYDVIVIGAGVAGLYQLFKLRQLKLKALVSKQAIMLAVHGIGIATQVLDLTQKVGPTGILSPRNSLRNGIGRNILPHNLIR